MLNKQALIDKVTDSTRLPRKNVELVVDEFVETIIEQLSRDEKINISGFGVFEVRVRKGRQAANPRNPSERIQVPSVRVAKFRPGKTLKEAVK